MPITTTTTTTISCDNPSCPNRDALPDGLSSDQPHGWLQVTLEVVGSTTLTGVFCTFDCALADSGAWRAEAA